MASIPMDDAYICHLCGIRPSDAKDGICPKHDLVLIDPEEHRKDPLDRYLGRTIAGRYPIVGIVGGGGMGAVYRAVQERVGREVALKVIRNTGGDQAEVRIRFEREARVVARLRHANTVTLHDFGDHDDGATLFMVLELLKGDTLGKAMRQGPMTSDEVCKIGAAVLDALVEAHGHGLIHRDIKPENIMLVPNEWGTTTVKVLDFGIAKAVAGEGATAEQLTKTDTMFGTLRYMSPEQTFAKPMDARSDLYSVGVVLYEALAGRHPFESEDVFQMVQGHRLAPAPPLAPHLGVPDDVEAILLRSLAKAPSDRFDSAAAMAGALRSAAGLKGAEQSGELSLAVVQAVDRPPTGNTIELDLVSASIEFAETGAAGPHAPAAISPPPGEAGGRPPTSLASIAGRQGGASKPVGGTSREVVGEMLRQAADGRGRRGRAWLAVPVLAGLAAVGIWVGPRLGGPGVPKRAKVVAPKAVGRPVRVPTQVARAAADAAEDAMRNGDVRGALAQLDEAERADSKFAEGHFIRARIHAGNGDAAATIRALDEYLGRNPSTEALAAQIKEAREFDSVAASREFQAWGREVGVLGPASAGTAPEPKATRVRVRGGDASARTGDVGRKAVEANRAEPKAPAPAPPPPRPKAAPVSNSTGALGVDPDL